jgi:hypothetical protein
MPKFLKDETHIVLRTTRYINGSIQVEFNTIGKPPKMETGIDVGPDVISTAIMTRRVITFQVGFNHITFPLDPTPMDGLTVYYGYAVELDDSDISLLESLGIPTGRYVSHPSGVLSDCGDATIIDPPASLS